MATEDQRAVFITDNSELYLVRCPDCKLENYALMVATGQCAWCGFSVNSNNNEKEQQQRDRSDN